jgi:RNA polymerase sigma factor (sigma-70 family)
VTPHPEENKLIDRILAGDQNEYATLVDRYKSYAFTIALKIVQNRSDAEEVAQDAFVKAFHYLRSFNREAKFSTWLYRIVFNTAISHHRKNRRPLESLQDTFGETGPSERNLEKEDKQVFIARAMEKLNETDRMALSLFYLQEFSLEEVAAIMEQNQNTIKVRVHRARLRLADELKGILKHEALTL